MKHTTTLTGTALGVALLAVVATGCGNLVERATEEAVERAVEEAVEADTGGDVDVEFNEDGISVESDEGEFSLNVDENGVEIDGTDADGNDFSLDADEDGINAQGDDGDAVFTSSEGIPPQWPSDVPEPDGLDEIFGTYISEGGNENVVVTGTTGDGAEDAFDEYTDRLTDAGFSEDSNFNQGGDFYSATFTRDDTTVNVTTQGSGDTTAVVIAID